MDALLARRRAALIDEVRSRYGVTLYPDPRREHIVRLTESDYAWLIDAVAHDRRIDAVGRGYYLGLGGELTLVRVADWTCDHDCVALLRARVLLLDRWARPVVRALAHVLTDGVPALRPWLLAAAVSLALGSTVAIAAVAGAAGASGTG